MNREAASENQLDYPMPRTCPFDPPSALIKLQEEEPIRRVRIWDGSHPWLVTGYNAAREILSDRRMSVDSDRPGYPFSSDGGRGRRQVNKVLTNMDDPEHQFVRRMLTRDFMVTRTRAMRPQIQESVDQLIEKMLAGPKPADFVEALALPLPSLVICQLLGVPYEDSRYLEELSRIQLSQLSTAEQTAAALRGMLDFLGKVVDEKDKNPQDDVISRLVVEQMRTRVMQRHEVVNACQTLFLAGHETTANQIALSTLVFLQNPELLERLRTAEDPAVIANAVEEMLRYLTVIHLGRARVATEDFKFHGQHIKAGDGVIVALNAANRDEDAFENPNQVDINRKARHHIAFGFGIHQCLGQPLARVELEVVYSTLYRRIPTLALAVPFEDIEFKNSLVYGVKALPVTW